MWAVPPERGGMASGIGGTTRFAGLLFGIVGLGSILTFHLHGYFLANLNLLGGLKPGEAGAFAERVAAGGRPWSSSQPWSAP